MEGNQTLQIHREDHADSREIDPENEDLITELNEKIRVARDHSEEWRNWAEDAYDRYSGHQWSEDDKQKLDEEGRPAIVFNRIARNINFVIGEEVQNRQEVRYLARELGDAKVNDILTAASKWVREQCDAEDEESEAFQDTLTTGMGWTETHMDYSTNQDGDIIIERIDPLEMLWDPNSKKRNLDDAKWVARVKYYGQDDFKEEWPEYADEVTAGRFFLDSNPEEHNASEAWRYERDQGHRMSRNNVISVIQMQWWELEHVYRVEDPTGPKILTEEQYKKAKKILNQYKIPHLRVPKKVFKQAIFAGTVMMDYTDISDNAFTFRCITGLRDRNKNLWFGLVRLMSDPQMWANKWLSQILHIINSNAKGGLLYEEGAFTDPRVVEEEWSRPNSAIKLNAGGLDKIQQREAPRYPEGVDRLLQYALESISDVPGINPELLGQTNRNQPIGVEALRKNAGMTILATFFDSLRRYRKEQGRVLAKMIINYISDGRLIRVIGEDGAKYVPLVTNNPGIIDYDVIVDDSPSSPNMRLKVFSAISSMLPMMIEAGIPIPPDVIEYAPLPSTLIDKWKEMLVSPPQPDPLQQQMEQLLLTEKLLQLQGMSADNEETQSKTILNTAKAQESLAVAEDEKAQAMQKMGLDQLAQEAKVRKMQQEQIAKTLDMIMNQRREDAKFALDQSRAERKFKMESQRSTQ